MSGRRVKALRRQFRDARGRDPRLASHGVEEAKVEVLASDLSKMPSTFRMQRLVIRLLRALGSELGQQRYAMMTRTRKVRILTPGGLSEWRRVKRAWKERHR